MLYKKLIEEHLPDKIILCDQSQSYCYQQLQDMSLALGQEWLDQGIRAGDRVIVACNHLIDTVIALLACIAYGIIFVPVEPDTDDMGYIIEDCEPALVYKGGISGGKTAKKRDVLPPDTIGYIIYTSGSTSTPKGVEAPFSAIHFCIDGINKRLENNSDDRILSRLPLSFDYGLYQVFFALCFESVLFLAGRDCNLLDIPKMAHDHKITALPVVPSMLSALLRARLLKKQYFPFLRYICSTGEVLDVALIAEVHKALPDVEIIPMYGLTECKRVSVMPPGRWDKIMSGSCGLPLDGVEVETLGDSDYEGELVVYGQNVMNGYWGEDAEDGGIFGTDCRGRRYLRTGDYFYIDPEGFLYFRYRLKNVIKVGGFSVSAAELEELLKQVDKILDVRVIGIPDKVSGEAVCACVYAEGTDTKEKIEAISGTLPKHKQIRKICFFDNPFPLNANGKVDIRALRNIVYERYAL